MYSALHRSAPRVRQSPRRFAGLPRIKLEDTVAAAQGLDWMRIGVDFADGLHLAKAEGCEAFISFDRDFVKAAHALGSIKGRTP
ncbi:hypothetical protein [Bradyrhizobium sp. DASA03120]|uniref:hypothetical protein n=1 Tax=Bradyrhizobium sp. SMVTL-02 TaxID=3395917 RepID=UPI003F7026F3